MRRSRMQAAWGLSLGLVLALPGLATALITGGTGNTPLPDPGWPAGAAALVNHPGRIAWWEGPPLGGGQWHAECRGDVAALNAALAAFARVDAPIKRLVVHDGPGSSFWIAPNGEPEKRAAARIDWSFSVWNPASWQQLRKFPPDLNPTGTADASPPTQLDVYTAQIDWAQVVVPEGLAVDDRRLVAHGFTPADGLVLEGVVTDLVGGQPLKAASVRIERVEPRREGGYAYPLAAEVKADAQGRWVVRHAPTGWVRVVVGADGFATRIAGHGRFDATPRWEPFPTALAPAAALVGRVVDEAGGAIADAEVRLADVEATGGTGRYQLGTEPTALTDFDGRFRFDGVPTGTARIFVHKAGYNGPGLGAEATAPGEPVTVVLARSSGLEIQVDFGDRTPPPGYLVHFEPEGGARVGSYSGSAPIDADRRHAFTDVPPGRYRVWGRPNPGSDTEQTEAVTVDLEPGQTTGVVLRAR